MWRFWVIGLVFLSGCQAFQRENPSLLMQNEMQAFATEASGLQATTQARSTAVSATVQAFNLQAQQQMGYNQILLATVRANEVPTPIERDVMQQGSVEAELMTSNDGTMRFDRISMAGYVNPDDSCADQAQDLFRASTTSVIYLTAIGVNILSGTSVTTTWVVNGQIMLESQWIAQADESQRCLAFALRPADAPFIVGNWTVNFAVDGQEIENVAFSILDG